MAKLVAVGPGDGIGSVVGMLAAKQSIGRDAAMNVEEGGNGMRLNPLVM